MSGNNAAQRLSELVERALGTGSSQAMTQGLNVLFNCAPADPYRHHAARLEQVHKQLDVAMAGLERLGVPRPLYESQLNSLRAGFSSSALNQPFQALHQHLTADVRLMLQWAAFMLEDEGGVVDPAEVNTLASSLETLIKEVTASSLPPTVRDFLSVHLQDLRDGLEMRPITGAEPLQKAVKTLAADIVAHEVELREADALPEDTKGSLLARASQLFNKAAEVAATAGKGAEGVGKVWNSATQAVPQIAHWAKLGWNLLTGPSNPNP